ELLKYDIMKLLNKVAIITGGGTGIGYAITKRFVEEGAKVCICGRRKEVLDEAIAKLGSNQAIASVSDVSKPDDVKRMVSDTLERFGKIDVLVNNAAINNPKKLLDLSFDEWKKILDVNLNGAFLTMREVIPLMIDQGGGSIINISSLAGVRVAPFFPAYCASKAALIALSQQVALDYAEYNIRCNVLCPGLTKTPPLEREFGQTGFERAAKLIPLRRVASPEEIAGACVYFASDDSSYVTGAVLLVDGGIAPVDAFMWSSLKDR
ncbi:MAG: SDR family oxidoreductase, partial [Deltaproteobacteria bacterium]|nr:SDR family oxidoreductase [Deltaproteobacteria bacterium]